MFESLAKEGDEFGQYWVAPSYFNGFGTTKDEEKGFNWYLKSAEQGLFPSIKIVANSYVTGRGCTLNEDQAYVWHKRALKQGPGFSSIFIEKYEKKRSNLNKK